MGEYPVEASRRRADPGQVECEGSCGGKLLRPTRRRRAVRTIGHRLGVAERHTCQVLGQPRFTQRDQVHPRGDEEA